jgi:hypothetical protein
MSRQLFAVLCLSSEGTAHHVSGCPSVGYFHHVGTVDQAVIALQSHQFDVLVAALGTDRESFLLRQASTRETGGDFNSILLESACSRVPGMMRIVYSWTASQSSNRSSPCIQCGADTVLSSPEELERAIQLFFSTSVVSSDDNNMGRPREVSSDAVGSHPAAVSSSDLCLANRTAREDMLQQLAGGRVTHRIQQSRFWTDRIQGQRTHLLSSRALIYPSFDTTIRVVHVSDTHNRHRSLSKSLPEAGDLFLHTGDIVGNYDHKTDLRAQLVNFLKWIDSVVCPKFDQIVLMAGNHDTLLDPDNPFFDPKAVEILSSFLSSHTKVAYLHNSSIVYRGLLIYGCPVCVCRQETKSKRYISNGFERTSEDRRRIWKQAPKNIDILLTHVPPAGLAAGAEEVTGEASSGCDVLAKEMYSNEKESPQVRRRRPILHAFGHTHAEFGFTHYEGTVLSNASQDLIIRTDTSAGGIPLVFNLALPK